MTKEETKAVKFAVYALQNDDVDLYPVVIQKLKTILSKKDKTEVDEVISLGKTFMELFYERTGLHQSGVAHELGITRAAVSIWQRNNKIPSSGIQKMRKRYGDELINSILIQLEKNSDAEEIEK